MILDKPQTIAEMLRFYGLEADVQAIRRTIAAVGPTRAVTALTRAWPDAVTAALSGAKQRIVVLSGHYPSNDFSLLGL